MCGTECLGVLLTAFLLYFVSAANVDHAVLIELVHCIIFLQISQTHIPPMAVVLSTAISTSLADASASNIANDLRFSSTLFKSSLSVSVILYIAFDLLILQTIFH